MGMSYSIDRERRLVRSRLWGAISTSDFIDLYSRLVMDPRFEPDFRSLSDLREVTVLRGDSMSFGTVASSELFLPGTRRGTVASRDDVLEMLRVFATYSARCGQVVRVFTDYDEAERWVEGGGGDDASAESSVHA